MLFNLIWTSLDGQFILYKKNALRQDSSSTNCQQIDKWNTKTCRIVFRTNYTKFFIEVKGLPDKKTLT